MPLVSPNKRHDQEEQPKTAEEIFVDQTRQKTTSFFQALGQMGHRTRTLHAPQGMKQLFHDIWFGNLGKKQRVNKKPLTTYQWLYGKYASRKSKPLPEAYSWQWSKYPRKRKR